MWCDELTGYVHTQVLSYCTLTIFSEFLGSQISFAMPSHHQPFTINAWGARGIAQSFTLSTISACWVIGPNPLQKAVPFAKSNDDDQRGNPHHLLGLIAEQVSANVPRYFDVIEVHHVHDYPWHVPGKSLRAERTNDSPGRIKPGKRSRPSEHLRNSLFRRGGSFQIRGKAFPCVSITAGALANFTFWCVNTVPFHNPP